MTGARELLDQYAAEHGNDMADRMDEIAPKAFAALRSVLRDCDFLDACIANYKGYEVAALIRGSITKALKAE